MAHYKGKRENSRCDQAQNHSDAKRDPSVGDPFSGEKRSFTEWLQDCALDLAWFFRTKKAKILVGTLCALLVVGAGAAIALDHWIKPPDIPAVQPPDNTDAPITDDQQQSPPDDTGNEQLPPTDDDLYPDDGYAGEMPTVSGERKEGVYTFLLVGTDMDDGNTDTIMVASYDTVQQKISIMSIPRDTMINESWDIKKINSVYSRTGNSISSLANRVRKLVGFKPDFYVKVDLSMFVELVDLVGGVDFYVPQDMKYDDPYQDLHIDLKEGQQTLDGEKAMQLVRFRGYAEGDIRRVAVQQDFLKALIKECLSMKHWGKIKAYIDLAMDNVQTDLEFGSVVWFAANVIGMNKAPALNMNDVYTCTIPGNYWASTWSRATNQNQSYVTIYANKTIALVNERFNPYVQNVTADMIDAMSILENGDIASSTGVLKDTTHNEVMAVRRGEAYYDEDGKLVYGDPDENTDPILPDDNDPGNGGETGTEADPGNETGSETDPEAGSETGSETDAEANDPGFGEDPTVPDEPSEPDGDAQ